MRQFATSERPARWKAADQLSRTTGLAVSRTNGRDMQA
jgi:hypothetical protein